MIYIFSMFLESRECELLSSIVLFHRNKFLELWNRVYREWMAQPPNSTDEKCKVQRQEMIQARKLLRLRIPIWRQALGSHET